MHQKEIGIFLLFKPQAQDEEINRWLSYIGVSDEFELPSVDDSDVTGVTDSALNIGLAAKRCYMSFEEGLNPNVTKIRRDWTEYLDNILASKHGSVLEHAHYSFAIEGVTRVFTGEMNRHRAGVGISEGSMRYIRLDDMPFWMPFSIRENGEFWQIDPEKAEETRNFLQDLFFNAETTYKELCALWEIDTGNLPFSVKKRLTSLFRRIAPMGTSTGGIWTLNFRALRHIIALRSSQHAEEEIAYVATEIGQRMVKEEPLLFGDFTRNQMGFWEPKYEKI